MEYRSNLERILKSGKFAVTAEIGPPKNADIEVIRRKAKILKGYVDAVNITDCQTAIVGVSSIASAVVLMAEGLEPVIQMTCRDRNRIGIQSDLLGAYVLGIEIFSVLQETIPSLEIIPRQNLFLILTLSSLFRW